jgi:hypothetical protein
LPSNYFRNGRRSVDEDDVSEVEKRLFEGEVTEIKTEQFFPASKKKEKTEEFSRFYYFENVDIN